MKLPLEFDDRLEVFYKGDILNAKIASRDRFFRGEVEVVIENEKRCFINASNIVSVNGKNLKMIDIAEINGIPRNVYRQRKEYGWDNDTAIRKFVRKR